VAWKLAGAAPEDPATQVGLFADLQAVITGLTSGTNITVIVTARNASGESAPVKVNVIVP
jgi:hypothetical protein